MVAVLASIKLLPVRRIVYNMFCSTLLTFGIGGFRTPATFTMELFVTKDKGWKLLLLLQRVPSCMYQNPRSHHQKA